MSYDWDPLPEDIASIRAWYDAWSPLVANVDFVPARELFDVRVAAFGTRMDVVEGRDNLENDQWRQIWPTIENFRFQTERLKTGTSPDRLMAIGLCPWTSTGRHLDGSAFARPGRATTVLTRAAIDNAWQSIHTHISLSPGTPQTSHCNRPPAP